jgi:hypothetical protein
MRSGDSLPGLKNRSPPPSFWRISPSNSLSQSRCSRALRVDLPWMGGRPVDRPPWKRHLPPAPRPGSRHGAPVWRLFAPHRGSPAKTSRALMSDGFMLSDPWGSRREKVSVIGSRGLQSGRTGTPLRGVSLSVRLAGILRS